MSFNALEASTKRAEALVDHGVVGIAIERSGNVSISRSMRYLHQAESFLLHLWAGPALLIAPAVR